MAGEQEKVLFILYVKDQKISRGFYREVFGKEPSLDVPGMTEFDITGNCRLGLMPEKGIVKLLGESVPAPEEGNGIPRCELYLYVDEPDEYYMKVIKTGGRGISKAKLRNWGDEVCYCSDPDGHILAFAKVK